MSKYRIAFNRPCLSGSELDYMAQAIEAGRISGDGPVTQDASDRLVRLRFYNDLTHIDQRQVVHSVRQFEAT